MKPDWDKLMDAFRDSQTTLIADVDCTAAGQELCEQMGIKSYPTLKFGDPKILDDYVGKRNFETLKQFAEQILHGTCGPAKPELCDEGTKAEIMKYKSMSHSELDAAIDEKQAEIEKHDGDFRAFVERLQQEYKQRNEKFHAELATIRQSRLQLMKAVSVHSRSAVNFKEL